MNDLRSPGLRTLQVDRVDAPCEAHAQLTIEQEMFDSWDPGAQRLRVWQPLPALIVTCGEAQQPTFATAAARSRERNLAVHVRRSGGGAVCLGPGMLVVSHLYTVARNDIDASYREFARSLICAIAAVGIAVCDQHVATAYCDGRFDLAWNGRKVGGMAQRRRVRDGMAQVWIHAVLAVESESLRHPQAVAEFYADLGSSRIADPRSATCLSECGSSRGSKDGLLGCCSDAIVAEFEDRAQSAALFRVD